jgi:hypothetical protein
LLERLRNQGGQAPATISSRLGQVGV